MMGGRGLLAKGNGQVILNGNEAIARGAIEAGVSVATSYPGTPSTEILTSLAKVSERLGIYVEWSVNELVAFEIATGAAYTGLRAICSMKHLGENTIVDALNVVNYTGVNGGLVLVVADDPEPIASQNALDSRYHAIAAKIPCLEPANGQEAKDVIRYAFDLSESVKLPVQVRLTSKLSHTNYVVSLGKVIRKKRKASFEKQPQRFVCIPSRSKNLHAELNQKNKRLKKVFDRVPFNRLERSKSNLGIIASGFSYNYVKEALGRLNARASVLKLSTTNPIPEKPIKGILKIASDILVVEELEPITERGAIEIAFESGYRGRIYGKRTGHIPQESELNTELVETAISDLLKLKRTHAKNVEVPRRTPSLCVGCAHRAFYFALNKALKSTGEEYVVIGDRGCYNLGAHPPLESIDTCLCMGASIPVASGFDKAGYKGRIIAVIGDSTFLHSGLEGLINSVYNNSNITITILDNNWTSMTGHQPNPGTGLNAHGKKAGKIDITELVKACKVDFYEKVDPFDVGRSIDAITKAVECEGVSVIIFERPCVLKSKYTGCGDYRINPDKCSGCMTCVETFGCPAIIKEGFKPRIDKEICVRCGVCVAVCPLGAIERR